MKKLLTLCLALALTISLPALAGDPKCEKCSRCDKPVQDCLNSMVVELKTTGFIGVELDKNEKTGALNVLKVIAGSPAEKAGIQPGDELYAINGIRFTKENGEKISKVKKPGAKVTCTIRRNGAEKVLQVTLVPMPADLMAKYIGEHMLLHAQQDADGQAKK